MEKLSELTKLRFFELLDGDLTSMEFGQWFNLNSEELKIELQRTMFSDIQLLDFEEKDLSEELYDRILSVIDQDEYNIWRIKKILRQILDNKIDIVLACRKLYDLYNETSGKLTPITLGVVYDSELDDLPIPSEYHLWNSEALKEKLKKVDLFKPEIIRDAQDCLNRLT